MCAQRRHDAAGRLFCMPSESGKEKQSFQNRNKNSKQMKGKKKKKRQGTIIEKRGAFVVGNYENPGPLG